METAIYNATKTKWTLDLAHSELIFKVKHLMISTVTGRFRNFTAAAETEAGDFSSATGIELKADIASIDTNNTDRDNHLRSADFFDADQYPSLVFRAPKFEAADGTLEGELTLRGVTKKIKLEVEPGGIATDPYGQTKAAFSVSGRISRKEFGLTWHAVTEAGGVVVGDEIKFNAEIQLVKQ